LRGLDAFEDLHRQWLGRQMTVKRTKGKRAGKTKADFFRDEQKALKPGQPELFGDLAETCAECGRPCATVR
jgi:hypothetical protein